jgi:DNA-directed RNA polymerase specialized sigma24 family protein
MNGEVPRQAQANMEATDLQRELELLHADSFGWALSCCRRRKDDAEEVLQTAYIKVLEGRAKFEGRSSFRTWFFGVIRHTASEQHRRQWLRDTLLTRWFAAQPLPSSGLAAPPKTGVDTCPLRRALGRLPERQQQVLHLVYYQDLTVEEAAGVLGVSLGTARTHFGRGKRRLRQLLAPQEVC